LSKLKVTGSLPTFVNLKDFFLVDPTTTFPKSQTYVAIEMLSRFTGVAIEPFTAVASGPDFFGASAVLLLDGAAAFSVAFLAEPSLLVANLSSLPPKPEPYESIMACC
jgi:hypothetical protein